VSDQVQRLLAAPDKRVLAVLVGGVDNPHLTGAIEEKGRVMRQMTAILADARQHRLLATAHARIAPVSIALVKVDQSAGSLARGRSATSQVGQTILFTLTVLLASMLLSNLIEEKSNKIIEVLAAAVPIDAIFMGKLVSMLAISLVGITVWTAASVAGLTLWSSGHINLPEPAVGWPAFVILVILYFSANYLLLGAIFLGIGSQASSVREVQTLSMPVTIGQVLIFLFASIASAQFNSFLGIAAAIFPFSSPLTMISRAAQTPELWPHGAALLWQAQWVWLTVQLGASLFRSNVMKSGGAGGGRKLKLKRAKA
jgi:ABC-2 type transport system permease protein